MIRLYGAEFSISLANQNVQQLGSNNVINNMNLAIDHRHGFSGCATQPEVKIPEAVAA